MGCFTMCVVSPMCIKLCRGDFSYFLFLRRFFPPFFPNEVVRVDFWVMIVWLFIQKKDDHLFLLVHYLTLDCSVSGPSLGKNREFPQWVNKFKLYMLPSVNWDLTPVFAFNHTLTAGNGAEVINQRGILRRAKCMYHKKVHSRHQEAHSTSLYT